MKASAFLSAALLAAGLVLGAAGCAQQPTITSLHPSSAGRSARTFALSVAVADGSALTAQQWATVKSAFQQQLAAAGYTLVDNIYEAERIIRVVFTPAIDDPSNGTATVLSVRSNPAYAYNSGRYGSPVFASYGFTSSYGFGQSPYGMWDYDNYYPSYVGSTAPVTPRHEPPTHNRPSNPDNCQPGTGNNGGQYAHHDGDRGTHYGPRPADSSGWSSSSSRSYDNGFSSSSYSSSYSGPSVSGYSSSSPSASFSSGSSSSSYSGPSVSSSSDYSSSSPSASFSSGGGGGSSISPTTSRSSN